MRVSRRWVIGALAAGAAGGAYMAVSQSRREIVRAELSPPDLFEAVERGDVLLIDIRRPDEWEQTGLARGAVPIDMRRDDFISALRAARGDETKPVAVICARGVRSRRLAEQLAQAGVDPVIDVPEGMLGSRAGPGWLERGLPIENYQN